MAIYIRISTDEDHQPFSLEAQHTRLLACIGTQPGWEFTGLVFRDEKSGAATDRKDLQRALGAARAGWFDILLVYRVDRLSRSMRGLVEILDQLDAARVGFSLGHRARGHLQLGRPDAGADARRLRPVRARDDHRPGD